MSGLLESTLGAVGAVGEAVDKATGGRALRGALAGKPRELASFVPFSDSMGLTDAKDRTSGRDLTDSYGLTKKGDTSFGSHAAGFLADNVLSPANMLGAYGAFKAAPTISRGITQGAKALSGLDLVDHIGGAAKGLGKKLAGFGSDELGAIKGPHIPPKPVDVDALHAESLSANATRPRRWSADPAARKWYSADRGRRYGQRMSGREIPRPGIGDGVPAFGLNDAFQRFAGDESGALNLGSGDSLLQHQPWAGRTDISPTTRNAAEWAGPGYSGGRDKIQGVLDTGKANAVSEHFGKLQKALLGHPMMGKIASEFPEDTRFLGHGAEALAGLSGEGHVIRAAPAQSWLGSSGRADIPQIVQPFRSIQIPGSPKLGASPWVVEHLPRVNPVLPGPTQRGRLQNILSALTQSGDTEGVRQGYDALRHLGHLENDSQGIGYDLSQMVSGQSPHLDPWDFRGHNISTTNEGRAIGHDGGMVKSRDKGDLITRYSPSIATDSAKAKAAKLGGQEAVREAMAGGLARGTVGQGVGAEGGIIGLPEAIRRQKLVADFLTKYGHMANPSAARLTGVTGFQSAPNSLAKEMAGMSVAKPSYSLTNAFQKFASGEEGSLDLSALMGRRPAAAVGEASNPARGIVDGAVSSLAGRFGQGGGKLYGDDAKDFAASFIEKPQFPPTPEGVAQAQEFAAKLGEGATAAKSYFGPMYYDLNKHLRSLGDSAPEEIAAIRSGKYRGASGNAQANTAQYQPPDSFYGTPVDPNAILPESFKTIDDWNKISPPPPAAAKFVPSTDKVSKFVDDFGLSGPSSAHIHFDGKGMAPISDGELASSFGPEWPSYKQHLISEGKPKQASPFKPNKDLSDEFYYKHGMYPYAMMGEHTGKAWENAIHDVFGDQSYDTIQYYKNKAIADGTATGLASNPASVPPTANGVSPGVLPEVRNLVDGLMGLFDHSRMPKDMELYRGIDGKGVRSIEQSLGVNFSDPAAVGREFTDPAFLSTSFDKADADSFAGITPGYKRPDRGVTFTFPNVPKGKPASMMNSTENEILFPPGRRIKITDNSGYPHLKAELYGTLLAAIMGGRAANNYQGS